MAWAGIAASLAGVALFLAMPTPCSGAGCAKPGSAGHNPAVVVNGPATPPAASWNGPEPNVAAKPAPSPAPTPQAVAASAAYKESGSVLAPMTAELYSDYECPHCATTFLTVMPEFIRDYVDTGKVRFIHRDFPLAQHQYARLAARYANAAGTLGHYDAVVQQLFRTQASWAVTGDIGTQVAQVLPAAVMQQVRQLVDSDTRLEETVNADMAAARQIPLTMTPTLVVTYKGKSQVLAPVPQYELLKSYMDELLSR
jgi:protein-disulfide isomerase